MSSRREFLNASLTTSALTGLSVAPARAVTRARPIVVSTWDFGVAANQVAWEVISRGGHALDAVEAGARVPEADMKNHTVGRAGYPDRDGHVSLDASIMDDQWRCGAVAALEHIAHPISVARRVLEKTPHVMLVGAGALQFALEQGFPREELLTPESDAAWKAWLKTQTYKPIANSEMSTYGHVPNSKLPGDVHNHDTLGILALDQQGRLSGACTTSGMAWKMRGRVGDSPIIGAGLYVDGEIGAATSTGVGEEVIRNSGSFLVVELMRQGLSPQRACEEAVMRIVRRRPETAKSLQVGFLALSRQGAVGAFAIQKGFVYARCDQNSVDQIIPAKSAFL
ncbi:N(4)-(beta-N-acetylglucosaminyl)-L-asparaginase [Asticcacaulis sp. DXS10W]|uniref:N(4)-(Beta-N-acetylglucosaminyl)-L-asparaginase n=1 Tax=Asticcacaulis currens TaxID=2984210 RepID=A0ABT5IE00_9CAUL|nr:N(4)-(beta-N-acetylglucosaminyl)-L-asparaginase [Asticcacaulis currens]MDC7694427.1 N(4)-(beta-N-acetylglucosaminyl)-L-asparaginase [Asticcacaulis currens]